MNFPAGPVISAILDIFVDDTFPVPASIIANDIRNPIFGRGDLFLDVIGISFKKAEVKAVIGLKPLICIDGEDIVRTPGSGLQGKVPVVPKVPPLMLE